MKKQNKKISKPHPQKPVDLKDPKKTVEKSPAPREEAAP